LGSPALGSGLIGFPTSTSPCSISVAFAVIYELAGGERARTTLEELKEWMIAHNGAVMAVLFLVFGVVLISKGLGPLSV